MENKIAQQIPFLSIIITTYNKPTWLQKVLWGYEEQSFKNFEIIIADDGSGEETKAVIQEFVEKGRLDINHVWHEDKGFRKTEILNKAIVQAKHDYLLFTDGDCIPRKDFLETHVGFIEEDRFLSGGYCKLPKELSELISHEDIASQRCFNPKWLKENGLVGASQFRKLSATKNWGRFYDTITTVGANFNGCNVSAWKQDILKVNGFDERMQYGGLDREIGERLENNGIKGKQIRHRAICVHLFHERGYKTKETMAKNKKIRKETKSKKKTATIYGIEKKAVVKS